MKHLLKRIGRKLGLLPQPQGSSAAYEVIDRETALATRLDGWHEESVAERQDIAYRKLLDGMRAGNPRVDMRAAADAVRATGLANPELLEIGCGSGYYSEILPELAGGPIRYTGLDYSEAMIVMARARYPERTFIAGDATALPFGDGSFDIVFNGAALMHIANYEAAIAESARVARGWCIFHTVTVHQGRPTTFLRKNAYGAPTVEVAFNEKELIEEFRRARLELRGSYTSIPYDLSHVLGEPTVSKTFLCARM